MDQMPLDEATVRSYRYQWGTYFIRLVLYIKRKLKENFSVINSSTAILSAASNRSQIPEDITDKLQELHMMFYCAIDEMCMHINSLQRILSTTNQAIFAIQNQMMDHAIVLCSSVETDVDLKKNELSTFAERLDNMNSGACDLKIRISNLITNTTEL